MGLSLGLLIATRIIGKLKRRRIVGLSFRGQSLRVRNSRSLHSGRDDTFVLGVEVLHGRFGREEGRTADPSATLRFGRDDKGEGSASVQIRSWMIEQQVPPHRFASVGMTHLFWMLGFYTEDSGESRGALQIPPLRYASVGMTKGEGGASVQIRSWMIEQQVPPHRFASVGMTHLFWVLGF